MQYFLILENNELIHLPDFRLTEGIREIVEVPQIGASPVFVQERKQPDVCVFTVPQGVTSLAPCLVVDEDGLVRRIRASQAEVGAHTLLAAGIVEDEFDAPELDEAKKLFAEEVKELS